MERDPQDRPDAPGRCHAAFARPGDRRARPAVGAFGRPGRRGDGGPASSCPSAARRSARASTRTSSSAAASANCWPRRPASRFVEAANHFEANAQRDALVECHGQLRTIASTLFNVANNIRWLASGPRCGLHEIKLPERQPGSSIMPGKVNPVLCESVMQVAARVLGNDQTIVVCGAAGGQFQLNVMMPVMADAVLESIRLLANVTDAFTSTVPGRHGSRRGSLRGVGRKEPCNGHRLESLHRLRARPRLAKEAFATGKTIRELCREKGVLPKSNSTRPSIRGE